MDLFLYLILLFSTFYLLSRVVDVYFIKTLEILSSKLKLSSDIAGATFMAVGSSAPELFVSFLALWRVGSEQSIGAGTIVGSAIFNILVIVGASAMYARAKLTWQPVIRDMSFYAISILVLLFTFKDGQISLFDASLFALLYVAYLFSFKYWKKLFPYTDSADQDTKPDADIEISEPRRNLVDKLIGLLFVDLDRRPQFYMYNFLVSIVLLGALSHFMVEAAVHIARGLGIPEVIIGLTILAAGTSIPDLLSSINVAKKGRGDMAIANAVGSNIFDIAVGLGLPWMIKLLIDGGSIPVSTENLTSSVVLLFATVIALVYLLIMKRWEMGRYAGLLLIFGYLLYLLIQMGWVSIDVCVLPNENQRCVSFSKSF